MASQAVVPRGRWTSHGLGTARRGLSIIELLIAGVISLIVLTAVIQLYVRVAAELARQRATIELSGQMRVLEHRLREDLKGVTVTVQPWQSANAAPGYFEIIEGPQADLRQAGASTIYVDTREAGRFDPWLGDRDDILCFTAHSDGAPFTGRFTDATGVTTPIQSQDAEIIWWARPMVPLGSSSEQRYVIHRRVLLIRPDFDPAKFTATTVADFYRTNDISVHLDTTAGRLVPNSLSDLARREFRFAHNLSGTFPFRIDAAGLQVPGSGWVLGGVFEGRDVIATDVLALDVKVLDPTVTTRYASLPTVDGVTPVVAVLPGDGGPTATWVGSTLAPYNGSPVDGNEAGTNRYQGAFTDGYVAAGATAQTTPSGVSPPTGTETGGAWVDLNYGRYTGGGVTSVFSGRMHIESGLRTASVATDFAVYDTWSRHYESNGLDENGDGVADAGTNGIDDSLGASTWGRSAVGANNIVDESNEYDTHPPYSAPLRGVQVTFRLREPDSGNIRQSSVVHAFVNN